MGKIEDAQLVELTYEYLNTSVYTKMHYNRRQKNVRKGAHRHSR